MLPVILIDESELSRLSCVTLIATAGASSEFIPVPVKVYAFCVLNSVLKSKVIFTIFALKCPLAI